MDITERARKIKPFYAMELLEKARDLEEGGRDIVHMEIGEPDFPSPSIVKEAAIETIKKDYTSYTHSLGLPQLRERISRYYSEEYGIDISPERVIITEGTSGAFLLLSLTLLEKGKVLGLPDPGYPCYKNFGYIAEAEILNFPISEDTGYEITPHHFKESGIPTLLILSNPSNPIGNLYSRKGIEGLYSVIEGRGTLVVDEVYSGLVYEGDFDTALSVSEEIIVVNGFSKTFAMTGWRLGWMVVSSKLVDPIHRIAQNIFISPPTISQHAAIKAFEARKELERMKRTYRVRRDFLLSRLKELGFHVPYRPMGPSISMEG